MKTLEYYLTLNYHNTIAKDEDGDYVVEVQELPGCIADGGTPDEAIANLREAMTSWIESRMEAGLSIPEPRSIDEYSGKVLLRMPKSLHCRLAQQAEIEGVSMNQHLVSLLSDASARRERSAQQPAANEYAEILGAGRIVNRVWAPLTPEPSLSPWINVLQTQWENASETPDLICSGRGMVVTYITKTATTVPTLPVPHQQRDLLPAMDNRNEA